MDSKFAQHFADEWVSAWNSHDLNQILMHYHDDFVMSSPVIIQTGFSTTGTLRGKGAVHAYWSKALSLFPQLHFELLNVFTGADSVVIHYRGHRGQAAEIFYFNAEGKVVRAAAHYQ